MIGSLRTGFGLFTLTTVLLCRNTLTDPADVDAGLALVATAFGAAGVGAGLAAVVTPSGDPRAWACAPGWWRRSSARPRVEAVFAVAVTPTLLVAGAFVLGLAAQAVKIGVDTVVQTSVDDAYRGRVFTFYDTVFNAAFLLAAVVAVLAVPPSGDQPWVFAGVAALFVATAVAYRAAGLISGRTPAAPRRGRRRRPTAATATPTTASALPATGTALRTTATFAAIAADRHEPADQPADGDQQDRQRREHLQPHGHLGTGAEALPAGVDRRERVQRRAAHDRLDRARRGRAAGSGCARRAAPRRRRPRPSAGRTGTARRSPGRPRRGRARAGVRASADCRTARGPPSTLRGRPPGRSTAAGRPRGRRSRPHREGPMCPGRTTAPREEPSVTQQQDQRPYPGQVNQFGTPFSPTASITPYAPTPAPESQSSAVAALVFAILLWPVALVLGPMALRRTRQPGVGGRGLALAGDLGRVRAARGCSSWASCWRS